MPRSVDSGHGASMRLPAGPVDDDNRWQHCRHCDDPCLILVHDDPCFDCEDGR
jgi:hypothetical protein